LQEAWDSYIQTSSADPNNNSNFWPGMNIDIPISGPLSGSESQTSGLDSQQQQQASSQNTFLGTSNVFMGVSTPPGLRYNK
jgi:hypothetical protein